MSTDNRVIRTRIMVNITAEVELELAPLADGQGTFIMAKMLEDGLMVSVAAGSKDMDDMPTEVKNYLTTSAGHTLCEAAVMKLGKRLDKNGDRDVPQPMGGEGVGQA